MLKKDVLSYFISIYIALVYILSTNSIFIDVLGFGLNPSKLFVIISLLVVFLFKAKFRLELTDLFFVFFILFGFFRTLVHSDANVLGDLTNFIIPFLFYKVLSSHLERINLKLILKIILFFVFFHAIFGIYQFYTGDRSLLIVSEIQEFKIKYAREYSFNPFETLLLLPHGLYSYSSVLAISLIFPLFLLVGSSSKIKFKTIIIFLLLSLTVFLTFSRFEILSIFLLLIFAMYVVKYYRIKYIRFFLIYFIGVCLIFLYISFTEDAIGSVSARMISLEMLRNIFDFKMLFFGMEGLDDFLFKYKIHIPHNMYIFLIMRYGIFAVFFLFLYLTLKIFMYIKRDLKNKLYSFILLFLLFIVFYRSFSYYVIDGYENILLFFICFLFLDVLRFHNPCK